MASNRRVRYVVVNPYLGKKQVSEPLQEGQKRRTTTTTQLSPQEQSQELVKHYESVTSQAEKQRVLNKLKEIDPETASQYIVKEQIQKEGPLIQSQISKAQEEELKKANVQQLGAYLYAYTTAQKEAEQQARYELKESYKRLLTGKSNLEKEEKRLKARLEKVSETGSSRFTELFNVSLKDRFTPKENKPRPNMIGPVEDIGEGPFITSMEELQKQEYKKKFPLRSRFFLGWDYYQTKLEQYTSKSPLIDPLIVGPTRFVKHSAEFLFRDTEVRKTKGPDLSLRKELINQNLLKTDLIKIKRSEPSPVTPSVAWGIVKERAGLLGQEWQYDSLALPRFTAEVLTSVGVSYGATKLVQKLRTPKIKVKVSTGKVTEVTRGKDQTTFTIKGKVAVQEKKLFGSTKTYQAPYSAEGLTFTQEGYTTELMKGEFIFRGTKYPFETIATTKITEPGVFMKAGFTYEGKSLYSFAGYGKTISPTETILEVGTKKGYWGEGKPILMERLKTFKGSEIRAPEGTWIQTDYNQIGTGIGKGYKIPKDQVFYSYIPEKGIPPLGVGLDLEPVGPIPQPIEPSFYPKVQPTPAITETAKQFITEPSTIPIIIPPSLEIPGSVDLIKPIEKQIPESLPSQTLEPSFIIEPKIDQSSIPKQKGASGLTTAQALTTEQITTTIVEPTPIIDITHRVVSAPTIQTPFVFPYADLPKTKFQEKKNLYNVSIRRKGIFKTIAKTTDLKKAFNIGMEKVDITSSASFKVEGPGALTFGRRFIDKRFRASFKEPGVFIEKRKYRISTPGEKKEITFKGIATRKMRGAFKNIFGG